MSLRGAVAAHAVEWLDDGPIELVGRPRDLQGEVRVDNTADERIVLRGAGLVAAGTQAPPVGAARTASQPVQLARLRSFSVRPKQRRSIPLSVDLGPHVAPGEYHAQVALGDVRRDAVLRVLPDPSLRFTPSRVMVANRPGETVTASVVAINTGNMALPVGEFGGVVLDDDLLSCRLARRALAEFDAEDDTFEDFLTEMVRQAKIVLEDPGPLVVAHRAGDLVLDPGERVTLELEITVPRQLDRHSRYTGVFTLHNAHLAFVVTPAPGSPAVPADRDEGSARATPSE